MDIPRSFDDLEKQLNEVTQKHTVIQDLQQKIEEFVGSFSLDTTMASVLELILNFCAVIIGFVLACMLLQLVFRGMQRIICSLYFQRQIPRGIKVRFAPLHKNELVIGRGAYWKYANRDDSRDKRRSGNKVLYARSHLCFKGFKLVGRNQIELYQLALDLRYAGHAVRMSRGEQIKYESENWKQGSLSLFSAAETIYTNFQLDPYAFEKFVGTIYQNLGYQIEPTPKSNDGGIDIKMLKNGVLTVVECKCYAPDTTVGRPIIQKLVGSAAGFGARGMIVVTTAKFTRNAQSYAAQMNVQLVDGGALTQLAKHAGLSIRESENSNGTKYWELSYKELLQRVPKDIMREIYEKSLPM